MPGQSVSEEPTAAAGLIIKLVTVQDGNGVTGTATIWPMPYQAAGWPAGAGGSFFIPRQSAPEEPTAAAELVIKLVPIQVPPGLPGGSCLMA